MTELSSLTALLAGEHVAVYAYGVLGAHLDVATRTTALAAFDAHRVLRNDLTERLRMRQVAGPTAAASYDVAVAGRTDALALAVRIEDSMAVLWRDLVAATEDRMLRRLAVQALQDCAVRATTWRRFAGLTPSTQALPGQV